MYSDLNKRDIKPWGSLFSILQLLILTTLLSACRSQTQQPPPTPRPNQSPNQFEIPDLKSLLDDQAQLPSGATSADISSRPHPSFSEVPEPQYFISSIYARGTRFGGRLSMFVYAFPEDLDAAWPRVLDTIVSPREISGPGDLAAVNHSDLAFIRCNTLVHIKLDGADPDELLTFAEKFDATLKPYVCSEN